MDPHTFNRYPLQQRLDAIAESGYFMLEEHAASGHTLFFALDKGYVSMYFPAEAPGITQVLAFNSDHPLFDHLLNLVPLDPQGVLERLR